MAELLFTKEQREEAQAFYNGNNIFFSDVEERVITPLIDIYFKYDIKLRYVCNFL